ncbi:hypothetical protein, variant [Verruconis gallopava]|uniref:FAD dependent oxidoreductase domain-containing protein n=1 Tax=Verruconis gallopava TaxID=253628 RepID=A0A0D1YMS6_9PEZI|nr:hypothetical protein, variant [Verruconis gallopava]KIW02037.1 hypothetical protein, variant [Verruconis gallopava]
MRDNEPGMWRAIENGTKPCKKSKKTRDRQEVGWVFTALSSTGEWPTALLRSGVHPSQRSRRSEDTSPPWFANEVKGFRMIGTRRINGKVLTGHEFESIMINVPRYLDYLRQRAVELGARSLKTTLPVSTTLAGTLRHAAEVVRHAVTATPIDAFVNATGISASRLVPDSAVFPIRGQTVTVKGEAKGITTVDASPDNVSPASPNITYVLPRPRSGTSILGGTKQAGDWAAEPDRLTTQEILDRAKEFAPELLDERGEFEVVSAQVGFRPGRKGGARVEIEEVRQPGGVGEAMVVCHSYGHAGAGYQNSIGNADEVVRLLEGYFKGRSASRANL